MKKIVLLTILITIGCILASGCVAQPKKDPGNTTVSSTPSFIPFVNSTPVPGLNGTINATNATNATATPKMKGPLRISIGRYSVDQPLAVLINNTSVGVVKAGVPLDLMVDEGNHSVKVCVGVICPEKFITIVFAKRSFLDFEEILNFSRQNSQNLLYESSNPTRTGMGLVLNWSS